jgi:hypothetical protein
MYSNTDHSPHKMMATFEKEYEDVNRLTLEELNRELDNNSNRYVMKVELIKSFCYSTGDAVWC